MPKCEFEIWLEVPGYLGLYEVSNKGNFRSIKNRKIMKVTRHPTNGYGYINLCKNGKATLYRAHRLVLIAFGYYPKQYQQCRHLDGNKLNNNLLNLRWGTASENHKDKVRHGTVGGAHPGELHHKAKLDREAIKRILELKDSGLFQSEIANLFKINQSQISRILNGKAWQKL